MGVPQSPTPPHLYPQALQLKLYQAFIFSIPILFSIILFLLFYLFYLKRRASHTLSSTPLPRRHHQRSHQTTTYVSSPFQLDLKVEVKDELPIVLFDEELRQKDSQCCVCLGDFVMKEELLQVPSCKHVFHVDCIHLWLHTNTTCPLCRCSVLPAADTAAKLHDPNLAAPPISTTSHQSPRVNSPLEQQQEQIQAQEEESSIGSSNTTNTTTTSVNNTTSNSSREQLTTITVPSEESSSATNRVINENNNNNNTDYAEPGSVIIHIQTRGT